MKNTPLTLVAAVCAVGIFSGAAMANPVAPGAVAFDEYGAVAVSLTGAAGDAENGAKVMRTKSLGNCISCHEVTALADSPFHGEIGPNLDGIGENRTEEELRGILTNSKKTFPGTMMPAYYKIDGFIRPGNRYTGKAPEGPLDPLLSAQQIEDVVAFLLTLK